MLSCWLTGLFSVYTILDLSLFCVELFTSVDSFAVEHFRWSVQRCRLRKQRAGRLKVPEYRTGRVLAVPVVLRRRPARAILMLLQQRLRRWQVWMLKLHRRQYAVILWMFYYQWLVFYHALDRVLRPRQLCHYTPYTNKFLNLQFLSRATLAINEIIIPGSSRFVINWLLLTKL